MNLPSAPPRRENLQRSLHGETPLSSMERRSQIRRRRTTWEHNTGYGYAARDRERRQSAPSSLPHRLRHEEGHDPRWQDCPSEELEVGPDEDDSDSALPLKAVVLSPLKRVYEGAQVCSVSLTTGPILFDERIRSISTAIAVIFSLRISFSSLLRSWHFDIRRSM